MAQRAGGLYKSRRGETGPRPKWRLVEGPWLSGTDQPYRGAEGHWGGSGLAPGRPVGTVGEGRMLSKVGAEDGRSRVLWAGERFRVEGPSGRVGLVQKRGTQGRAPRAARVGCTRPTPRPPPRSQPRSRPPTWALVPEAPPRLLLAGSVFAPAPPPPARPSRCRARAVPARPAPRSAPPSGPAPPAKVTAAPRPAASIAPPGHSPRVPCPGPPPSPACVRPLPNPCPAHTGSSLPPGDR